MSARQTGRSAGVLSRLAARLFEKNRAQAVAGRSFVPAHVPVARPACFPDLPQGFLKKIELKLLLADLSFQLTYPSLGRSQFGGHGCRI
jgi:hypothetical protein